jgi:outer membrane protein assembly factor BamB
MQIEWTFDVKNSFDVIGTDGAIQSIPIFSNPVIDPNNGNLIFSSVDGCLHCLNSAEGRELWNSKISNNSVFSSPCLIFEHVNKQNSCSNCLVNLIEFESETTIFFCNFFLIGGHDGKLKKVCLKSGVMEWEINLGTVIFSTPSMIENKNCCVVTTSGGKIFEVEIFSGKILSEITLNGEIFSSAVESSRKLSKYYDSRSETKFQIFVGCRDDRIYCLES